MPRPQPFPILNHSGVDIVEKMNFKNIGIGCKKTKNISSRAIGLYIWQMFLKIKSMFFPATSLVYGRNTHLQETLMDLVPLLLQSLVEDHLPYPVLSQNQHAGHDEKSCVQVSLYF